MLLPLAIILIVPMCLLFAIAGVWVSGGDNNIFTQIGFLVLVGLACKNAILIVEFAKSQRESGMAREQATLAACFRTVRRASSTRSRTAASSAGSTISRRSSLLMSSISFA